MQTRTYLAADMREALAAMRAELGDDAMILKSETTKDGSVCLYAGCDADEAQDTGGGAEEAGSATNVVPFASFEARHRERLVASLRTDPTIRRSLPSLPFDRAALMGILGTHRVPDRMSAMLSDEAQASQLPDLALALASALDKRMPTQAIETEAKALFVLGPFGAGKTSVAARLAAHAQRAGREVMLVATDLEGAGQVARLEAFAGHLDLAVTPAPSSGIFAEILETARQNGALMIADSAGFDPRADDPRLYDGVGEVENIGVVSACGDAEDAVDIAAGLARHGVKRLVVTGLDVARRKGALVAFATSGMTIAQVTSSPYLGDGVESFSPLQLARMLLSPME